MVGYLHNTSSYCLMTDSIPRTQIVIPKTQNSSDMIDVEQITIVKNVGSRIVSAHTENSIGNKTRNKEMHPSPTLSKPSPNATRTIESGCEDNARSLLTQFVFLIIYLIVD